MTVIRSKLLPALLVGVIALAGSACAKDKMMGDGSMMSDTGTMNKTQGDSMNKEDAGKNMSSHDGKM